MSESALYSQCPECRTVFRVTLEQLQARDGLVRCGQCSHVFQADQHLYSDMAVVPKKTKAVPKRHSSTEKKVHKGKSKPAAAPAITDIIAAPPRWSPQATTPENENPEPSVETPAAKHGRRKKSRDSTTLTLDVSPRRRSGSVLWILGSLLLLGSFTAQVAYFHRDTLAQYPEWRPFVLDACEQLAQFGCMIRPHSDVNRIELLDPTGIAPHPRVPNALRLRATMVNRSDRPQSYPLMQITLTDGTGNLLSRRTFAPNEYLEQPAADNEMPSHLAITALLDITNPDGKAVGYQIDFVPPPVH